MASNQLETNSGPQGVQKVNGDSELESLRSALLEERKIQPGLKTQPELLGRRFEEAPKSIDAQFARVLQQFWQIAARASGAPALETLPMDQNPYLETLTKECSPEEFYVSRATEPGPIAGELTSRPLIGSFDELHLQIALEIDRLGQNRVEIQRFMVSTVAATIENLERNAIGVPENHVDIIFMPLSRLRPKICSVSVRRFTAGLWGYLQQQREEHRQAGYFVTLGALADFLTEARGIDCFTQCIVYYHEILRHFLGIAKLEGNLDPDDQQRVRAASNNAANILDEIRRLRGRQVQDSQVTHVIHLLKKISLTLEAEGDNIPSTELGEAVSLVAALLEEEEVAVPVRWAVLLDNMMRNPAAWKAGRSDLQLAFLEAASALVRVVVEERSTDAPSSLFNAGVSVLRLIVDEGVADKEPFHRSRALLSGLGLWWALKLGGEDPSEALWKNDGLQCAVNLFGGCSDLSWDHSGKELLGRIAAALDFWRKRLPPEHEMSFLRITNSLKDLKINLASPAPAGTPIELRQSVAKLVERLWSDLGHGQAPSSLEEDPFHASVAALRAVFHRLSGGEERYKSELVDHLRNLLAEMEEVAENPAETLLNLYNELAGGGAQDPGMGPIVASSLMTREDWDAKYREAIDLRVTSLAAFLRLEGVLDWLIA